jgi:hypothetical protein
MATRSKVATERNETESDKPFVAAVRKMLATPPKPHDEMKVGAARKRDARSSGKGSKS